MVIVGKAFSGWDLKRRGRSLVPSVILVLPYKVRQLVSDISRLTCIRLPRGSYPVRFSVAKKTHLKTKPPPIQRGFGSKSNNQEIQPRSFIALTTLSMLTM